MSRASGKRTACMKSACVSVASPRGETKRCFKSARIPGQPMNPISPLRGETNTQMIANNSQSSLLRGKTNTQQTSLLRGDSNTAINQSGFPDETQFITDFASPRGDSNLLESKSLQTCADLANGNQLESYHNNIKLII